MLWMQRKGRDTHIPFGPYLALGGIVSLVWGHAAVVWWLGWYPA
jgi:leader peptidase (prepilin peptidase)/N-methyltransferase